MRINLIKSLLTLLFVFTSTFVNANEPIYYEVLYPESDEPAPAIIVLHTSGGFEKGTQRRAEEYVDEGFVVYMPDFFERHDLSESNRYETWTTYREPIEKELSQIVKIMKHDKRINPNNIFALGHSNGGYWAAYLAATNQVNAGASHFGVWQWYGSHNGYPANYFNDNSNPILALHGENDRVQKYERIKPEWSIAKSNGANLTTHTYSAGHSWDCKNCGRRDESVANDAFWKTVNFFNEHTK